MKVTPADLARVGDDVPLTPIQQTIVRVLTPIILTKILEELEGPDTSEPPSARRTE